MWLDDDALADHFENVKAKLNSGSDTGSAWENVEDGDTQNDLTRDLRRK